MKCGLILSLLIAMPCMGQTTGNATTYGPCSPAISGNNNRVIMNCQGAGKEKVEQPAFHEKSDFVTFAFGESAFIYTQSVERLRKGVYSPMIFDKFVPMTLTMKGDSLLFSFKVWSQSGRPPIEVENNEFKINMPECDWNYTANALEVVNARGEPIFQMIRKSPSRFVVNGIFPTPSGLVLFSPKGMDLLVANIPKDFSLTPIFKYPAWKFPGKYADGSN